MNGEVCRDDDDRQWYFAHDALIVPVGPFATRTGAELALQAYLMERGIYE